MDVQYLIFKNENVRRILLQPKKVIQKVSAATTSMVC